MSAIDAGLIKTMEDALKVLRQASQPLGPMGAEWLERQEQKLKGEDGYTNLPWSMFIAFSHPSPDHPAHGGSMKRFARLVPVVAGLVLLIECHSQLGRRCPYPDLCRPRL